jgi:hypothetical protein
MPLHVIMKCMGRNELCLRNDEHKQASTRDSRTCVRPLILVLLVLLQQRVLSTNLLEQLEQIARSE